MGVTVFVAFILIDVGFAGCPLCLSHLRSCRPALPCRTMRRDSNRARIQQRCSAAWSVRVTVSR